MRCPFCGKQEDKVVDSRSSRDGATIRRRRECIACGQRFTTYETVEATPITVVKRDGQMQPYSRDKILRGVRLAVKKRPVRSDQVDRLVDDIEMELFGHQSREVPSSEIGKMVLERLEQVDKVAYMRFASVYKDFKTTGAFLDELKHITR